MPLRPQTLTSRLQAGLSRAAAALRGLWQAGLANSLEGGLKSSTVAAIPGVPSTEPLLNALVASSPDAIFAKDVAGRYLLFNPAASRIAGREAAEVLGNDDRALFGPERAARIRDTDHRVMERDQPETYEEELDTPMGRRTFMATRGPLHDEPGGIQGVYGVSRDITEMVETRRRLTQGELRYRQLFKASPLPIPLRRPSAARIAAFGR